MRVQELIAAGESSRIVFKDCKNGIHTDVFETICAFLNSGGGTLLLGVKENGAVQGMPPRALPEIIKGLVRAAENPEIFRPTFYLSPREEIVEGRHILVLEVPESPEVHALRGRIFVRRGADNAVLKQRDELAGIYIRKQGVYTERKIYPHLRTDDLRMDLLARVRTLVKKQNTDSDWTNREDSAVLDRLNLSGEDYQTGEKGLRFLAAVLLGKDRTIQNIFANTDIFCEKRQDEQIVRLRLDTNLLDEAQALDEFLADVLPQEKRNMFWSAIFARREYAAAYTARLRVTDREVLAEFASGSGRYGNPLLIKVMKEIGLYREPDGSLMQDVENGICTLRMSRAVSERTMEDVEAQAARREGKALERRQRTESSKGDGKLTPQQRGTVILEMMAQNERVTVPAMVDRLHVAKRTILRDIEKLKNKNLVRREGSEKSGRWVLTGGLSAK